MFRCVRGATFAFLSIGVFSIVGCMTAASAETLRCQSVNGNVNCAGSNGVACQTVNGKKTCVSGNGDVVQSFGKGTSSNSSVQDSGDGVDADDEGPDDTSPPKGTRKPPEQRGSATTR
jgi:hypothetical protein